MGLGRRESSHETALSRKQAVGEQGGEFAPGQRVMTVDGIPGVVDEVIFSGVMGEQYRVTLEDGAGGGIYGPSQLTPMASRVVAGAHLASEDYPELTEILQQRPDIALPTHLGSLQTTAATRADFQFEHEDRDAGGVQYGPKRILRAIHPETGENAGELRYFMPKRKGAPAWVESLSTEHPGAGSALMDEMESRHPGSRVRHTDERPMSKGKPHYDHPDYGNPSGWDEHYPNLPDQIHRGMGVRLSGSDARAVTQGIGSPAEHAEILRDHLNNNGPMGMHWSAKESITRNFAHRNIRDPRVDVPVIVHADVPDRKHIETRPNVLKQRGVWAHDYEYGDAEVPIKRGGNVTIRGISWKPDAPHPEADEDGWVHHTFDEPLRHRASLQVQAAQEEHYDPACAYHHEGPCPEWTDSHEASLHTAMPSKSGQSPEWFSYDISGDKLNGYIAGQHAGHIQHDSVDKDGNWSTDPEHVTGVKVRMLHTTEGRRGSGIASAMMDALYKHYPHAWINHGFRTDAGSHWWDRYDEPDPQRNIHNVAPDEHTPGMAHHWTKHYDPQEVAGDMDMNYDTNTDEGHDGNEDRQWDHRDPYLQSYKTASHAPEEPEDEEYEHYDPDCAYEHEGPCHEWPQHHQAMPAKSGKPPRGKFTYQVKPGNWGETHLDGYINGEHAGRIQHTAYNQDGSAVHGSPDASAVKVGMLETHPSHRGSGVASAMMDALHKHYSKAWINHGWRTANGSTWWNNYDEPDPGRNVHNVSPTNHNHGMREHWTNFFDVPDVANDMDKNYATNQSLGHEGNAHREWDTVEHGSSGYGCESCNSDGNHFCGDCEQNYPHGEEGDYHKDCPIQCDHCDFDGEHECSKCGDFIKHDNVERHAQAHAINDAADRKLASNDDGSHETLYRGLHLGEATPEEVEHLHRDPVGYLKQHSFDSKQTGIHWTDSPHSAVNFAMDRDPSGNAHEGDDWGDEDEGPSHTHGVVLHGRVAPHHILEPGTEEWDNYAAFNGIFDHDHGEQERTVRDKAPVHITHVTALSSDPEGGWDRETTAPWGHHVTANQQDGGFEDVSDADPMEDMVHEASSDDDYRMSHRPTEDGPPAHDMGSGMAEDVYTHPQYWGSGSVTPSEREGYNQLRKARGNPEAPVTIYRASPPGAPHVMNPGDWISLSRSYAHDHGEMRHAEDGETGEQWSVHKATVPAKHVRDAGTDVYREQGYWGPPVSSEPDEPMRRRAAFDPYAMLTTAAGDPEFAFHVTASWADVRRKAKRIRAEGKVRITLASDGLVFGEVQGDHHTYDTGVQRFPGSKHSVATYTCGCKWGAYHWGAQDDFSRFAGRMCSHALALQYEAASRGMFGKDVKEDSTKPDWVPKKVVLRYDIDNRENKMVRSSKLEVTPLVALARWASAQGDDREEFNFALTASGLAGAAGLVMEAVGEWQSPEEEAPDRFDAVELLGQHGVHFRSDGPLSADRDDTPDLEHTIQIHPEDPLYTEQGDLNSKVLDHYRQHGPAVPHPPTSQRDHAEPDLPHRPTVVTHNGQNWLTDGHHRALVHRERGEPFTAWHVDSDRERREYEEWTRRRQAAVNNAWGEPSPPQNSYTPGPTKPRNLSENPGSSGWATQGDPDNWDAITPNGLGDRVAAQDDEFLFEGAIPQEVAQSDDPLGSMPGTEDTPLENGVTAAQEGPPRPSGPKGGTGGDMPPGFPQMPQHQDLTEATLHMEPEGALPFTDGDGPDLTDDESLTPPHTASVTDIVAAFQATAGYLMANSSPAAPAGDTGDIAAAAKAHLAKVAVKDFSAAEQAAIINEGANVRAANLDRLDIADTHYAHLTDGEEDDGAWMM